MRCVIKALHCNYEFYQVADFSMIEWQMSKKKNMDDLIRSTLVPLTLHILSYENSVD